MVGVVDIASEFEMQGSSGVCDQVLDMTLFGLHVGEYQRDGEPLYHVQTCKLSLIKRDVLACMHADYVKAWGADRRRITASRLDRD